MESAYWVRTLVKIDKLLGVFCEIATGSRDDFKIKSISSSELNIVLESLPAVAVLIATALERISAVYERILNIINLHKEMKRNNIPETMLKEMESFIEKTLSHEIEEAAKEIENGVLRKVKESRLNELRTELKQTLKEIASIFDRVYIFDVRGSLSSESDLAEESDAAPDTPPWQRKVVAEKREKLKHFKVEDKPILGLPEPDVATDS